MRISTMYYIFINFFDVNIEQDMTFLTKIKKLYEKINLQKKKLDMILKVYVKFNNYEKYCEIY